MNNPDVGTFGTVSNQPQQNGTPTVGGVRSLRETIKVLEALIASALGRKQVVDAVASSGLNKDDFMATMTTAAPTNSQSDPTQATIGQNVAAADQDIDKLKGVLDTLKQTGTTNATREERIAATQKAFADLNAGGLQADLTKAIADDKKATDSLTQGIDNKVAAGTLNQDQQTALVQGLDAAKKGTDGVSNSFRDPNRTHLQPLGGGVNIGTPLVITPQDQGGTTTVTVNSDPLKAAPAPIVETQLPFNRLQFVAPTPGTTTQPISTGHPVINNITQTAADKARAILGAPPTQNLAAATKADTPGGAQTAFKTAEQNMNATFGAAGTAAATAAITQQAQVDMSNAFGGINGAVQAYNAPESTASVKADLATATAAQKTTLPIPIQTPQQQMAGIQSFNQAQMDMTKTFGGTTAAVQAYNAPETTASVKADLAVATATAKVTPASAPAPAPTSYTSRAGAVAAAAAPKKTTAPAPVIPSAGSTLPKSGGLKMI